jgi:release factor glutamine methyltransferase
MIRRLTGEFRTARIEQPALDARLLVGAALELSAERMLIDRDKCPSDAEIDRIVAYAKRRLAREPVSRIIGRRGFFGRDFEIGPAVLDPRPDTELLVEHALDYIDRLAAAPHRELPLTVLDVGTGSGAIIVSLLAERRELRGTGIDLAPDALAIARRNAQRIGVLERLDLITMPVEDIGRLRFDVLVANLPYIATSSIAALDPEVVLFDPTLALDGGADGLAVFALLFRTLEGMAWTGPVLLEIGVGQGTAVVQQAQRLWPTSVRMRNRVALDLDGRGRCVILEPHA